MIYVECKSDQALVRSITNIPRKEIIHEPGKSRVCEKLAKQRNCRGLVDEDPLSTQPPYMKKVRLENDLFQYELKVFYDESNRNYLFLLCPRLEEWILKAAQEVDLNVGGYHLPNIPEKLHRVINLNLDKFEGLLEGLKDSKRLKTLGELLESC
jgi:hypothetical protein